MRLSRIGWKCAAIASISDTGMNSCRIVYPTSRTSAAYWAASFVFHIFKDFNEQSMIWRIKPDLRIHHLLLLHYFSTQRMGPFSAHNTYRILVWKSGQAIPRHAHIHIYIIYIMHNIYMYMCADLLRPEFALNRTAAAKGSVLWQRAGPWR
jgi:hypothetical protein